jgi:small multidrug resistance family-3 protein
LCHAPGVITGRGEDRRNEKHRTVDAKSHGEPPRHILATPAVADDEFSDASGEWLWTGSRREGRDDHIWSSEDHGLIGSPEMKLLQNIGPVWFLLVATTLEVSGDAIVRKAIFEHAGAARVWFFVAGAALLFGYGVSLNLAPVPFARVVGLYIATLFVVWQVINTIAFRTYPTTPIAVGGLLIVAGGLIVTFGSRP